MENDQQDQGQNLSQDTEKGSSERKGTNKGFDTNNVPEYRLEELNRKKKEAEQANKSLENEVQELRQQIDQQQEERMQQKGEVQKLNDKLKTDLQKEKAAHAETKQSWQRERRLNTWHSAAQGIIRGDALTDAFKLLSEDELASVDDGSEDDFRKLAETLVDLKPFLGVEGPRGAGSGGSSRPVMVGGGSQENKHPNFLGESKRKRRPWK